MNKCAEDLKVIGYSLTVNRRERCSRYMMGRIYGRLNVIFKFAKSNRAKTVKSQNQKIDVNVMHKDNKGGDHKGQPANTPCLFVKRVLELN